jgi:hypothetical protein
MGIENVLEGHGFGIAITGMTVVFAGLVLVSLYLTLLPRFFQWYASAPWQRRARTGPGGAPVRAPAPVRTASRGMDPDVLVAITYVLQAERELQLALDSQLITQRDSDEEQRVWTAIGKMRTLATRL